MKFTITFKDPDGVYRGVRDYVESLDIPEECWEELMDLHHERAQKTIAPWVEYSEYITIEFDTEKGTANVVKRHNS